MNAFKLFKQWDQNQQHLDEKILGFIYNVITDSLSLVTSFAIEELSSGNDNNNDQIKRSKWNESFVASFKELKRFMRQTSKLGGKSVSFDSLAALDLNNP